MMRRVFTCGSVLTAAIVVASSGMVGRAQSPTGVPTPQLTKLASDKPGSAGRNYPFFSTDIVLKNFGYVEEEFFFDGAANTYTTPELGRDADVVTTGTPYRSRMLVRRPSTPARFNGVVIVEWLNVTNGYDTDVLWLYQKEFLLREGYAWVGVSAQSAGLSREPNGIKLWSPTRYGSLDVDGKGTVAGDGLAYDIYSQAGAAVKRAPALLGGLRPTLVMAAGQSQSAQRLGPYLNGVHSRSPIYDAALLTVWSVPMRSDLTIPVIKVLSETERATSRQYPESGKVRVWPVAGATHSEQYSLLSRAAFLKRDLGLEAVDACATPARSRVEIRYVYNAATDALVQWVRSGREAARAPQFEYDEMATAPVPAPAAAGGGGAGVVGRGGQAGGARGGAGRGAAGPAEKPVKRDALGNVMGGIRTAEIAAPVARESAELCGLGGTHVPFDAETINRLYPSQADYVAKVTAASKGLVASGFLLAADAEATIAKARRSVWGRQLVCGPLCADVAQFPKGPSSMLLANQTAFLVIKGADATMLRTADEVTLLVAQGYTLGATATARRKFEEAASRLDRYIAQARAIEQKGDMPAETAALLVTQATTLQQALRAQAVALGTPAG